MKKVDLKTFDKMPVFHNLLGVDGKYYSSEDFADKPILVIVFSCNHCPYVQAYESRMISFQKDFAERGVQLVAINSNETVNYPEDKYEEMVRNARRKNFNFIYLRDEDQSVANAFGATHTPEFYVFDKDRSLRYRGKMDDNWKEPHNVKENYLRDAVESILTGKDVRVPETFSIGCTIKWKSE